MKWLLKRFSYTRELEAALRETRTEADETFRFLEWFKKDLEEYREKETTYTKLTLDEAHELFSACVDYQRALVMVNTPDPVQHRILPIMEKYGITIERNTLADNVSEETLKEIVEYLNSDAGGPKPDANA